MLSVVRRVAYLWSTLIILATLMVVIGHMQPAPDWTLLVNCHQPCWAGLNPDLTTAVKAWSILSSQPEFTLYHNGDDTRGFEVSVGPHRYQFVASVEVGQDLTTFKVMPRDPILLGDVLVFFGTPEYFYHYESCNGGHCADDIYLWFPAQRVEAMFQVQDSLSLSYTTPLRGFIFGQLTNNLRRGCPWQGLTHLTPTDRCYLTNRR